VTKFRSLTMMMMMTERVFETSVQYTHLTRLNLALHYI